MKVIVIYYSRGGTTKSMAELIHKTIKSKGVEADISPVEQFSYQNLLDYDGIIIGSPTYYGTCSAEIKKLIDDSVSLHRKLDGKVGAVFSSSANVAGGNETTALSILEALLIHGMIVQGDPQGDHYGLVAVTSVDERCKSNCVRFAERFVELLKKVVK